MTPPNSSPRDFADDGDGRRLEQLLRDAAPACIDDAGFSTRVLGALPPSRRQAKTRRLALIGAGTVGGKFREGVARMRARLSGEEFAGHGATGRVGRG